MQLRSTKHAIIDLDSTRLCHTGSTDRLNIERKPQPRLAV
jgi:hypothetical protein